MNDSQKKMLLGIMNVVIGIVFNLHSWVHEIGTLADMGPSMFPLILSFLLIVLGIILIYKSKWK